MRRKREIEGERGSGEERGSGKERREGGGERGGKEEGRGDRERWKEIDTGCFPSNVIF